MSTKTNIGLPGTEVRKQFPIFNQGGTNLAFLDSAASSQKPKSVIDRLADYLSYEHANIHRGAYALSGEATAHYEESRQQIADYINAPTAESVIFTRGTTESLNLVAHSIELFFKPGDAILLTVLEHHSNIVPWQMLAERKKLKLEFVDVHDDGSLNTDDFKAKLKSAKPKLVSITQVSNALGTVVPLAELIPLAKAEGALVLVDAAQALPHATVDVQALNPDFLAFSGHKLYGPTGIGALYAKPELQEKMTPFLGGGDMIEQVALEGSTWAKPPQRFEAGTPPIAEAIALGTAIDFMKSVGATSIAAHETELLQYAFEQLSAFDDVTLYGPITAGKEQASILSFSVDGIHAHDLSTVADTRNVQFRAGHHCAMPLMKRMGVQATARISFGVYNIQEDVDQLLDAIAAARKLFK